MGRVIPWVIVLSLCLAAPLPSAGQVVERAAEVPVLTEGPTADSAGNIYFTELRSQRIYRLGTDSELTVFREKSDGANGLVIDPQGRLIACEGNANGHTPRITRTDLKTGAIEVIADAYQGTPFRGANDITIDSRGRLYFTDPGASSIYRIDAPGQVAKVLGMPDIERPNGLMISPDDRTLYVIDSASFPNGPSLIRAFDLSPEGTARNGRTHFSFPGRGGDGMSVDTQGNLYVSAGVSYTAPPGAVAAARAWPTSAQQTKTGIYVLSPAGRQLNFIPIPEDAITNNAFGGPDMKTLYVTSGRTLFKVRTEIAGLPR
jgi:gluconolactonase